MKNNLIVSPSPHLHNNESTSRIMWMVVISLIPAAIAAAFFFGPRALWVILLGIVSAVAAEAFLQLVTKRKITVSDGSAVITGILLAYNLSPNVPFWIPIVGAFFSVAIGKHVFGGLGQNIFNPALVGRVFLMASWPEFMVKFTPTVKSLAWGFSHPLTYDAIASATPLAQIKEGKVIEHISYLHLFLGNKGGCIGEICIWALLLGALFLLIKGYISWHIPLTYISTVGSLTFIFAGKGLASGDWLFHILSGGLILGAFFMATDYVTSPLTRKGQVIFGAGCGLFTAVIRLWGGYPEGASYAILIMNAATPIIDRYTKNRLYGIKSKSPP